MALSLEQLREGVTESQALQWAIDLLTGLGFSATSWREGDIQRTIVELFTKNYSDLIDTIRGVAESGFNEFAAGTWLDAFSESHYDNTRDPGTYTIGTVTITDTQSTGPHTIGVGEVVVADSEGHRYRNITGGTLTLGSTLSPSFQADLVGSEYDVAAGAITVVEEGPPGVTVSNAANWITQNGADAESDVALRARNRSKWATLAYAAPAAAYENWARNANSAVTRVRVDDSNPRGPGTIDVYIAGANGDLSASVVDAVTAYLNGDTDNDGNVDTGRAPLGSDVVAYSASEVVVVVVGSIYVDSAYTAQTTTLAVQNALDEWIKTYPIGGVRTASSTGYFLLTRLYAALFSDPTTPGIVGLNLSSPAADIAMTVGQVVTLDVSGVSVVTAMS